MARHGKRIVHLYTENELPHVHSHNLTVNDTTDLIEKVIKPRIGARLFPDTITAANYLAFYDALAEAGLSLKRRRRVHACLSSYQRGRMTLTAGSRCVWEGYWSRRSDLNRGPADYEIP